MTQYALVNKATTLVENIVEYDGEKEFAYDSNYELVKIGNKFCNLGYLYINGQFSKPGEES